MDNFYGPLSTSVCINRVFTVKCNGTYDTIFELGKIWGRKRSHKKERGSPSMLPLITGDLQTWV